MRRLIQILVLGMTGLLLAAIGGGLWARGQIRASLPQLEGSHRLSGLSASVEVSRDALGIPTVRGRTRLDVARATGFLHAQDRFFQMDLARRRAAGELAALVGARAVPVDRAIRIHRFRAEAVRAVTLLSAEDRALLDAYTGGVNDGLESLGTSPFEYLLLRQSPAPWAAEDSLLVVLSMFVTLQDTDGEYETTLATMHDVLPERMFDVLSPRGSEWDAPLTGDAFTVTPIPGPDVYDLRARRTGRPAPSARPGPIARVRDLETELWAPGTPPQNDGAIGSNNFAVAGRLTLNGGALVANDMHLGIRVPNTWYRASLEWPRAADAASEPNRLMGLTLPGVPALVVGSNTHVAWGFTNTYADWSDIVLLEVDAARPNEYRTPDGWRAFERHDEVIAVAGEAEQRLEVRSTIWGPVIAPDYRGRPRAYHWVAHSEERLAAAIAPFETSRTVDEAIAIANGLGTPGQNFVVADRSGQIGWSVYGSIPRRVGFDGQLPQSWADGSRRWDGWLADEEYPRLVNPANGRVWTANARAVDGAMLGTLGDGGYDIGARARLIRDRLTAKDTFVARDLLDIQLDTSADFLDRWRTLLVRTLTADAVTGRAERTLLRDIVANEWSGQAAADSAAYRLTRAFREVVSERVIGFVLAECYEADPAFDYTRIRRRDTAIWSLVREQPQHLLDPQYATWAEFLTAAVDATIEQVMRGHEGDLRRRVWAEQNLGAFRHPLSAGLPFIGRLLDMPYAELPGDLYTPRVHWGITGASQRMVVSPGRESEGIMQMPTGQSGHPLSPFYASSHPSWVAGDATPFLPGPTQHTLTLVP